MSAGFNIGQRVKLKFEILSARFRLDLDVILLALVLDDDFRKGGGLVPFCQMKRGWMEEEEPVTEAMAKK